MRRLAASALVPVAVAGVAACGVEPKPQAKPLGPPLTKAQYLTRVRDIGRNVRSSPETAPGAGALAKAAARADKAREALSEIGERMGRLNPPPSVRRAHRLFVSALPRLGAQFGPVASALRQGDLKRTGELLRAIRASAAARQVREAQQMFVRRGYRFIALPSTPAPS